MQLPYYICILWQCINGETINVLSMHYSPGCLASTPACPDFTPTHGQVTGVRDHRKGSHSLGKSTR